MNSYWNIDTDNEICLDGIQECSLTSGQVDSIFEKLNIAQDQAIQPIPFENLSSTDFFILEAIIVKSDESYDSSRLAEFLIKCLEVPAEIKWNWDTVTSLSIKYYHGLRLLRVMEQYSSKIMDHSIVVPLISYHINPHTPWGSVTNSLLVKSIISGSDQLNEAIQKSLPQYIAIDFKSNLLKIEASGKYTGLNPRLGQIMEEDVRKAWKSSSKVKSISMTWFIISESNDSIFESHWRPLISFILNVLDDHEPIFKYQACLLINLLLTRLKKNNKLHLIQNSGLYQILSDSIRKGLNYLPPSTPEEESELLLTESYRGLYLLLDCSDNQSLSLVSIINDNIISSISRLLTSKPSKIILLLIKELDFIITHLLHTDVMLTFSKVAYAINQIITNGNLYWQTGTEMDIIVATLSCQNSLFQQFINLNDPQSYELICAYKYDFFGGWIIVLKRSNQDGNEKLISAVKENLHQLAVIMDQTHNKDGNSFDSIVHELVDKVPGMGKYLQTI